MAYAQLKTQESAGIAGEVQAEGKGGVMHIADVNGRKYERQRRERRMELKFAAAWALIICVGAVLIVLAMGRATP